MDRAVPPADVHLLVIMGVAGAGKTTVGRELARDLGWQFHDADEYHSAANVAKMHRGEGLTDEDRRPWLDTLRALVGDILKRGGYAVLACSALRQAYRDALVPADTPSDKVRFVYLDVPVDVLRARLAARQHHFATPDLLPSQFATLEQPADALRVDGARPVAEIVATVERELHLTRRAAPHSH